MSRPTIETSRLILRPFELDDAASVQKLAGEWEIADTTSKIPHPYEDGMAEEWISTHGPDFEKDKSATFAVVLRETGELVGACGLTIDRSAECAELGYWIGIPYWRQGFATEASRAVVEFGFDVLNLSRIHACHLARNPPSGRVMQKLGMRLEGTAHEDMFMWGKHEDVVTYGLLRDDWIEIRQ